MIKVAETEKGPVYLPEVDMYTRAEDAARALWTSVHAEASRVGGSALLFTPDDGDWGYSVYWKGGPADWAVVYALSDGACPAEFAVEASFAYYEADEPIGVGLTARFTDTA
jgi:hypothetical protein